MSLTRLMIWRRCLSSPVRASPGEHALERRVVALMALIASSTSVRWRVGRWPEMGPGFFRQKMLTARYSSGPRGRRLRFAIEFVLRLKGVGDVLEKIRPRTVVLVLGASMLLRRPSAICQALKPWLAPVSWLWLGSRHHIILWSGAYSGNELTGLVARSDSDMMLCLRSFLCL